jgi:predicted flap endonuclease-1-like 5' DNA nuclease
MDRQIRSFFAVVALVGAIIVAVYHSISGSPIGDYWLAAALFILAIVIWLWPSNDRTALFDLDPALRDDSSSGDHAKEAYPLNLLEEAPQALGDVPEVAPSEVTGGAVKILQDSPVEERLTEIVANADAVEIAEADAIISTVPAVEVASEVIEETETEAETTLEAPETDVEPVEPEIEPIEVVSTDAVTTDAIITENAVQVDAVTPDVAKPSGVPDVPVVDTTPLPDYAQAEIAVEETDQPEATEETAEDIPPTDAPEPYSTASNGSDDVETPVDTPVSDEGTTVSDEEASTYSKPSTDEATAVEATTTHDVTAGADAEVFDLTKIEGIGVKYQEALHNAGITTFEQLAELSVERLAEIAQEAGMRRAGSMETWAEQARLAANGEWDALQTLQDKLIGGRRES